MDKKVNEVEQLAKLTRQLVSDIQGAPYPGDDFQPELYKIWFEHVQSNAQNCFEFLDANFPEDKKEFAEALKKMFK